MYVGNTSFRRNSNGCGEAVGGIFAIIVIVSVAVVCFGGNAFVTTDAREASAQDNAVDWAHEQGYTAEGQDPLRVSCSGSDSDGDGYVSCTIRVPGVGGEEDKTIPIECGYDKPIAPFGQNNGCKLGAPYWFGRRGGSL